MRVTRPARGLAPDSNALVYVTSDFDSPNLVIMRADGTDRRRLLQRFGDHSEPNVGPRFAPAAIGSDA